MTDAEFDQEHMPMRTRTILALMLFAFAVLTVAALALGYPLIAGGLMGMVLGGTIVGVLFAREIAANPRVMKEFLT